jgi:aryl-alcohol dehydrogenase-like predicted oxidoreductase
VPTGGRFGGSRLADLYRQRYWDPRLFEAVSALKMIADGAGMTLVELSLRWLVGNPDVDTILIGASRVDQLGSNILTALKGALPTDIVAACDEVGRELRGPMSNYNR